MRDSTKADAVLLDLFSDAAKEQDLKLFKAELGSEESYCEALAGCSACFHLASPLIFGAVSDPVREVPATTSHPNRIPKETLQAHPSSLFSISSGGETSD